MSDNADVKDRMITTDGKLELIMAMVHELKQRPAFVTFDIVSKLADKQLRHISAIHALERTNKRLRHALEEKNRQLVDLTTIMGNKLPMELNQWIEKERETRKLNRERNRKHKNNHVKVDDSGRVRQMENAAAS